MQADLTARDDVRQIAIAPRCSASASLTKFAIGSVALDPPRDQALAPAAMVLIGTTHPKEDDLSFLRMPVTKIFASNDGVAPRERVPSNRRLLPPHTRMVEIDGGNHSQFGHYGHQLFDGRPTSAEPPSPKVP